MFTIGNYQLSHYIEARHCIEKEAFKLATERLDERALFYRADFKKQEY